MKKVLSIAGVFLFGLLIAGAVYVCENSKPFDVNSLSTWDKHMYYQQKADALFDTLYDYDQHNLDPPVQWVYRYDQLCDSAIKYLLEYRRHTDSL